MGEKCFSTWETHWVAWTWKACDEWLASASLFANKAWLFLELGWNRPSPCNQHQHPSALSVPIGLLLSHSSSCQMPRPSYGQEGKWGKGHTTEEWTLLYHLERGLLNKPLEWSCFILLKCLHSNEASALIPYIGRWKENRICTHSSSIRYQLFKKSSHLSTF